MTTVPEAKQDIVPLSAKIALSGLEVKPTTETQGTPVLTFGREI